MRRAIRRDRTAGSAVCAIRDGGCWPGFTDRGLVTQESWTPTTDFDPALVRRMATRLGGLPVIGTGAGHDAGILANDGIRSAMLFVRNPTGVSHSPDEWASADDCLDGIAALADVVTDLAGAGA